MAGRRIVYVGYFRFPEGDAAAARVMGIGKALRDFGYEVQFAGGEKRGRPEDQLDDGSFAYQGFPYHSTDDLRNRPLPPGRRLRNYFAYGRKTVNWLSAGSPRGLAAVVAYHGSTGFLMRIQRWCRARGVPLITDCTEWYNAAHELGGNWGLVRWDTEVRLRYMNARIGHVIAISRYLETYYRNKKCHVLRVPPLVDVHDEKWRVKPTRPCDGRELRLVYAGTPGRKDLIGNVLVAIGQLRQSGIPVRLDILGPTREQTATLLGTLAGCLDELGSSVVCHGRVPQSTVPKHLAEADFSILVRPVARYAQAGFPTKIVESLAAGVPVMTNATSDLDMYVSDGSEGIVLKDHSSAAVVEGIRRVLALPRERWSSMRQCAFQRAVASFDYRNYTESLGRFVESIHGSGDRETVQ